ncbi:MAG: UDP-N-acetylglucosamine 1-carboxyvinyltransferase [Oscillospiraceae bacterium]|nr:UDP-N-acetylglucosamine 1-carboxyvinyltransferase [Oscillospiraceae bacterium]
MDRYMIRGGNALHGEVEISGAKNAAVAIIPAALMVEGVCRIENIPQISDVSLLLKILEDMGAEIRVVNRNTVDIDCSKVQKTTASFELMRKIRASYYLIGAGLARFGHAEVAMPGGCNFGVRPIDQHIKGFQVLGGEVTVNGGMVYANAPEGLVGGTVYLDVVSVGATMNIMIAATLAKGKTTIENAAREPHIVDLANFLNSMGADIRGAGTSVIRVYGAKKLTGGFYSIIPDQIEAGTYMAAVAAAGGEVLIKNVIPKHLDCITSKLQEMGVTIVDLDEAVLIKRDKPLCRTNVKTMPYPGFPTDMQPQIAAALCLAGGTSIVTESVWDNRYKYVDELKKMGAMIQVDGKTAVIEGADVLTGAPVSCCDLRAGAALVIAGLCAQGETIVEQIHYIERGYEDLVSKLKSLGADIEYLKAPIDPEEKSTLRAIS